MKVVEELSISECGVRSAWQKIQPIVLRTILSKHEGLSEKYQCDLYLKREDLQVVRSYKIRGAFNKISSLSKEIQDKGVVCSSAGNHAQGVSYCCKKLGINGSIFMPVNTPNQKVDRVRTLGEKFINIFLTGETYDECAEAALSYSKENALTLIPPFDDEKIIEGQATVGYEILMDQKEVDYLFIPIGGGGLAAGVGSYFKRYSPGTVIIGAEPSGAASMTAAFEAGKPVCLEKINPFVDGAAVRQVGRLNYPICRNVLNAIVTVPEGKVCSIVLSLYNEDGIVIEPAGALSIAALDDFAEEIIGKKVVCILSGGNNDSNRIEEIKKLADTWEGLQHYIIIRFHHYPDGLKYFFSNILGAEDYVNRIEYVRRDHGRSTYAMVGIRSKDRQNYYQLTERLKHTGVEFQEMQKEDFLFKYWV